MNKNLGKILNAPYPFDVVDANRRKAESKFGRDFIIDFGIGDPTDPTPEVVREACREAADETKTLGYPSALGSSVFLEAVRHYMDARFGVALNANDIVPTYGAKYAAFHLPCYYMNPGKGEAALVPNPGYPPYADGTMLAGGIPCFLNMLEENDFEPDFEKIPKDTLKKSKLLFLNSPHSPTGKVYSKEKLKEAVDLCLDNGIILVSDECYADLYFDKPPMSILQIKGAEECALVLNSLSKRSMMTGYAVGFLASKNRELLKPYAAIQRKSIQGVANVVQYAAAAAFLDEKHPEEMRKTYKQRLDTLIPALEKAGCTVRKPEGTFFVWAKVPKKDTPMEFCERLLLEKGINSVPGNLISRKHDGINPGERYARFALVPSIEKTREAAKRIAGN
ncbi:MAG: aminotransferase class I/II-fold pyridoxal phosphate-dependent enzyme [Candidatus Altiarchaeota archaeon]|nr:aminotransferase class I/II-fold pyridoxal phosphate-dependent enzyme [Candidatus Altiarchaeota archaeon]